MDALSWLVRNDVLADSLPVWDPAAGWPAATCAVFAAAIPAMFRAVPMSREALSRALRRRFDPDEVQPWKFVAAPAGPADVWLVHEPTVTRRP